MKTLMRLLLIVVIVGLFVFLHFYIGSNNMGVLNPKGVIALAEKNLMITVVSLMLIVVIPVFIMLFSFAWRYRKGNKKAKYTPEWHTNPLLETIWWAVPTIIIVLLGTITWKSTHDLDPFKPLDSQMQPMVIQVVALDWKWLFIYPDERIATVNFVEIPKDIPVEFRITSDAPMNSFWIPQLGSQIYAMQGMTAKLHLSSSEVGDYKGVSANFSGGGFSGMKFVTRVVSKEEYTQWLNTVRFSPLALTFTEYSELAKQSKNNPVQYYGLVEDGLYNKIIMKFMPNKHKMDGMDMNNH